MNKSQITNLALNILSTNSLIHSTGIHILEIKPCILCKQKFISHPDEPIKEFTMATCGCIYHQKCLKGYLLDIVKNRSNSTYPNWDCKGREIETLITQDLFKEMGKSTTPTVGNTVNMQVNSENLTPIDDKEVDYKIDSENLTPVDDTNNPLEQGSHAEDQLMNSTKTSFDQARETDLGKGEEEMSEVDVEQTVLDQEIGVNVENEDNLLEVIEEQSNHRQKIDVDNT
ncbi:9126_t:CDS:2, partial [Funneliformis caledonium]